jgi:SAM-dependent methyltransferase
MPFSFQRVSSLFKPCSGGLPHATQESGTIDFLSLPLASTPLTVVPTLEAIAVSHSSETYQKALALQAQAYTRAIKPSPDAFSKYRAIVDVAPQNTIPVVVRRRNALMPDTLVGTARLELPSATTIEAIVHFQPSSLAASVLARRAFAEVGSFATAELDWWEKLDVIDTVASAMVELAKRYKLEWMWIFPRRSMLSLLLADIPDLLPPYRFTLCSDVASWNEASKSLQKIRELQMKELPVSPGTLPILIQITPEKWAEDIRERLSLWGRRRQHPDLPRLLQAAMRQAHRKMDAQIAWLHAQAKKEEMTTVENSKEVQSPLSASDPSIAARYVENHTRPTSVPDEQKQGGFLPFAASSQDEANYLREVMRQGGETVRSYKTLSFDLLEIRPGMRILDVGCGVGLDLPALADRAGEAGLVVGVDHDPDLLQKAKEATAGRNNIQVIVAEAQKMPFPDHSFDGIRADRVLQHISKPVEVLGEIWRVLRPGGTLTLIEPDWGTIALFPGSPEGGDDDHTWSAIITLCRRRLAHALIGRQLAAFLQQQGRSFWTGIQAQVVAYLLASWPVTDSVLQVSNLAQALVKEEPARADEVNAWLQAVEAAAVHGEFLACVPLFFIRAYKVDSQ